MYIVRPVNDDILISSDIVNSICNELFIKDNHKIIIIILPLQVNLVMFKSQKCSYNIFQFMPADENTVYTIIDQPESVIIGNVIS